MRRVSQQKSAIVTADDAITLGKGNEDGHLWYNARQFEIVTGAQVARHTRKQSESGGSVRGEAALVLGDTAVVFTFGLLFGAAGRVKRLGAIHPQKPNIMESDGRSNREWSSASSMANPSFSSGETSTKMAARSQRTQRQKTDGALARLRRAEKRGDVASSVASALLLNLPASGTKCVSEEERSQEGKGLRSLPRVPFYPVVAQWSCTVPLGAWSTPWLSLVASSSAESSSPTIRKRSRMDDPEVAARRSALNVGQMAQIQPIMDFSEAHSPKSHLY
ncbi:hypothetical protein B296_00058373 [Ensete ventricosum]|uniref:Uncharacterized protein n=1 Tax=Ensete ventricosum TaxID=4639 RepID=A0A426X0Y7_ENSVE|nr:hypothetical protein B296_00058373 [Ensete ventricosum]